MIGLLYRAADGLRRRTIRDNPGRVGEDLAHRYLRSHGCTIVARNYRTPSGSGEIDIIAWQGGTLVFVEVKTRATTDFGEPDRAVDVRKRDHLRRAARDYLRRTDTEWGQARFDIVSIVLSRPVQIDWIQDAFR
jgi:putative endonuclease